MVVCLFWVLPWSTGLMSMRGMDLCLPWTRGICVLKVTVRLVMPRPRGLMSLPCLDLCLPWTGGTCVLLLSVRLVPIAFIHVARVRRTLLLESLCIDDLEPCLTVVSVSCLWITFSPVMLIGFVVSGYFPSTVTGPKILSRGYDRDLSSTSKLAQIG